MGGWWKEVEWAVRSWIFDTDTKQTKIVKAVVFQEQSQCLILALYRKGNAKPYACTQCNYYAMFVTMRDYQTYISIHFHQMPNHNILMLCTFTY
jgi:hypothetical protein